MKGRRFLAAWAGATVLGSALALAQSDTNRLTVPFTDPSRPGTVNVSLFNGGITVRASTGRDVIVTAKDGRVANSREQPSGKGAGLRRLSQPAGLSVTEADNVMTISNGSPVGGGDVDVQVPARTNLKLNTVNGGEILVEGIDGQIEATTLNAQITLHDVTGAVVAHATNGQVLATLKQVTADKPMSFTSLNGDVDVTLPPAVKANLKMRTDHGEVLTDFDVQIQPRPATSLPSVFVAPPAPPSPPQPPLPPLPPARPGADSSERERQARERVRQLAERERQIRDQKGAVRIELDSSIYGTVNGGGPEFELRTFNGSIYLRKGK